MQSDAGLNCFQYMQFVSANCFKYLSNTPVQNRPQNQLKMISIWLTSIEGKFGELYRTRRGSLCVKYTQASSTVQYNVVQKAEMSFAHK